MEKVNSLFSEDSHLNEEGVALFVDALKLDKTDRLPEAVREHVAGCQTCRKNVTGLFALVADQEYRSTGAHPYLDRSLREQTPRFANAYRIAAALVAAAGIAVLAYYVATVNSARESLRTGMAAHEGAGDTAAHHAPPLKSAAGNEVRYAANFTPSPDLEDLVGSHFRSGSFEVRSPKIGADVGDNIVFDWSAQPSGPFTVTVLNNKAETVVRMPVRTVPFDLRKHFAPGVYYWKVQNAEEILFVGKFVVR